MIQLFTKIEVFFFLFLFFIIQIAENPYEKYICMCAQMLVRPAGIKVSEFLKALEFFLRFSAVSWNLALSDCWTACIIKLPTKNIFCATR